MIKLAHTNIASAATLALVLLSSLSGCGNTTPSVVANPQPVNTSSQPGYVVLPEDSAEGSKKITILDARFGKVVEGEDDEVHPSVTKLSLHRLSDKDMLLLKPSGNVTKLILDGCSIGSQGLARLAYWPNLQEVTFSDCKQVDDWGIVLLKDVPNLRVLRLEKGHRVTGAGISGLQQVKPGLRIEMK